MITTRRSLFKQIGLGLAGIGLANLKSSSAPITSQFHKSFVTGDIPILLGSNENPYGPSPLARKAIADNLTVSNRYNWEISSQLIADIAKKNKLSDENILIGAGSTELLDLVSKFAASEHGNYIIAHPCYYYWTTTLDYLGLKKIEVPLTAGKEIDLPSMLLAISPATKLLYICNPNNPSGTICNREELVNFIAKVPATATILVDEAYLEFTKQQSLSNLIHRFPNLIIVKTFSKIYGLAGARIGYAISNKLTIDRLGRLQSAPDSSVSVLSRLLAMASLNDEKFVSDSYALNEAVRKYTMTELEKLNCACISSNTNFIYFSLANFRKDYFQLLKDHNIQGTGIYEENGKWTRITVGTMVEMKQFIKAIG